MIPTITTYLYEIQHNRDYYVALIERRRAMKLALALCITIAILLVLWSTKL